MIYFRRRLHTWLMNYAEEHGLRMYDLILQIVLKWAKEHGFKCPHRFPNPLQLTVRGNREYVRCLLCGDLIPREEVGYIRYDKLYPDLEDLK